MPKMSPREARKAAFLKRQQASQRVSAGFQGIFKPNENLKLWKCTKGRHDIDIIPYQAGSHDPQMDKGDWTYVLEVFVHNNVGTEEDKMFICMLKTYGKPCPICEHRRELIERDADEDLVKSLTVSKYPRSIYNVLCHDDPKHRNEVQIFNTSHYLMERQLIESAQSSPRQIEEGYPPVIDFADPEEGYGITFTRDGEGRNTTFTGINFNKRKKYIPESILEKAYVLDEIIHIPTYDEVYEAFWGQKREDVEDADDEKETPRREVSKGRRPSSKSSSRKEEPEEEDEDDSYLNKDKESDVVEGECPNGGVFGEDHSQFDECENCGVWDDCLIAAEQLGEGASDKEDESEEEEEEERPSRSRASKKGSSRRREEPEEEEEEEEEEPEEEEEEERRPSRASRTTRHSSKPSGKSSTRNSGRANGRSSSSRRSEGSSGPKTGKSSTRTRRAMR